MTRWILVAGMASLPVAGGGWRSFGSLAGTYKFPSPAPLP
jgi:hypothetical protein